MTCGESTINAFVRVAGPPNWAYYSPQACLLPGGEVRLDRLAPQAIGNGARAGDLEERRAVSAVRVGEAHDVSRVDTARLFDPGESGCHCRHHTPNRSFSYGEWLFAIQHATLMEDSEGTCG